MNTPRFALALCALGSLALPGQAQDDAAPAAPAAARSSTPPFRILFVSEGEGVDRDRADLVCAELERAAQAAGMTAVDRSQAELLASKGREMLGGWLGDEMNRDVRLGTLAYADLVVRVTLETARERKQQGRYVSRLRGQFRTVFTDGAEIVSSGQADGNGRSFDSFGEAHREAIRDLCNQSSEESLGFQVVRGLKAAKAAEAASGARVTVGIYVESNLLKLFEPLQRAVASADAIVDGSVQPLRNYAGGPLADGSANTALELGARMRGDVYDLQRALMKALDQASPEIEKELGLALAPTFLASGRRIDVIVKAVESPKALADDVNRVVKDAVESAWSRNQHLLDGKRLTVLPASISSASQETKDYRAFQRGFRSMLDAVEKRLAESGKPDADPLAATGEVEVAGQEFNSLAAAKTKLMELEETFYESSGGQLATQLSDSVANWFKDVSKGAAKVQPTARDRDRAIDLIKLEAEAYQQEGAVDPDSVAFYEQEGSEYLVTTTLREFFDKYMVTVDLVDLSTGQKLQGTSSFHPRVSAELEQKIGG